MGEHNRKNWTQGKYIAALAKEWAPTLARCVAYFTEELGKEDNLLTLSYYWAKFRNSLHGTVNTLQSTTLGPLESLLQRPIQSNYLCTPVNIEFLDRLLFGVLSYLCFPSHSLIFSLICSCFLFFTFALTLSKHSSNVAFTYWFWISQWS